MSYEGSVEETSALKQELEPYVSVETFQDYTKKYTEDDVLPQVYLDAAAEKVSQYLGYDPRARTYEVTIRGDGCDILSLPAPVIKVEGVLEDAREISEMDFDFEFKKNHLTLWKGYEAKTFFKGVPYTVRFRGGYDQVPKPIVMATIQIASLYEEAGGGNLAVSSTSFADTGSRVFQDFRIQKFLDEINNYRIYC